MEASDINFFDHFKTLKDPRIERSQLHGMFEIIFLTLCGVMSGCEGWIDIEDYGKSHLTLLRKYLPYANGIPSDDTLRRFFRAVDSEQLNGCFINWIKSIVKLEHLNGKVIAIDGKTACGSGNETQAALHLVSAYATDLRLVLCQQKVAEKSNEITAIPVLLDMLDTRGAIVSIDAMGTQKSIALKIHEKGGDYLLALKRNQGDTYDAAETFFKLERKNDFKDVTVDRFSTIEKGHGRIEKRICYVADAVGIISPEKEWANLRSIVCVDSEREIKGKASKETRYYITCLGHTLHVHRQKIGNFCWLMHCTKKQP